MILTLDLGTSTTKAVVWDPTGPRALGTGSLSSDFCAPDRAEQDPSSWWESVVAACGGARAGSPGTFDAVEAIGFAAARQTFVPVTAAGAPIGPALLWSDGRAGAEAQVMAEGLGGVEAVRARTGTVLDGAALAAKVAWLGAHEPDRLAAARWLLTPRDLVLLTMTGEVVTDTTMVSAAGLSDFSGTLLAGLVAVLGDRLPAVAAPDTVVGTLSPAAASELGLRPGLPVVVGAGDRACEVLGTAAAPDRPMVSWGTTANVSVPVAEVPPSLPDAVTVTRGAAGGWLLEGGLSAAGSLLHWLSTLTGTPADALMAAAGASPVGARGVLALPWLGGARAPWRRPSAAGGFLGLRFPHDAGDLARALVESVAFDARRVLASLSEAPAVTAAGPLPPPTSLCLTGVTGAGRTTGAGGGRPPWVDILTGVTGLPATSRRSGQAASAGAALLTARAVGAPYDLDHFDPPAETARPDPEVVARYEALRPRVDAVADLVVTLGWGGAEGPG